MITGWGIERPSVDPLLFPFSTMAMVFKAGDVEGGASHLQGKFAACESGDTLYGFLQTFSAYDHHCISIS